MVKKIQKQRKALWNKLNEMRNELDDLMREIVDSEKSGELEELRDDVNKSLTEFSGKTWESVEAEGIKAMNRILSGVS